MPDPYEERYVAFLRQANEALPADLPEADRAAKLQEALDHALERDLEALAGPATEKVRAALEALGEDGADGGDDALTQARRLLEEIG